MKWVGALVWATVVFVMWWYSFHTGYTTHLNKQNAGVFD